VQRVAFLALRVAVTGSPSFLRREPSAPPHYAPSPPCRRRPHCPVSVPRIALFVLVQPALRIVHPSPIEALRLRACRRSRACGPAWPSDLDPADRI
jgi:hypothetical protein